jgi:peptidyl-prolyl cis-trans isomerase SurA
MLECPSFRAVRGVAVSLIVFVSMSSSISAQLLDRIVAIVNQQVITLSDARAAATLHLLAPSVEPGREAASAKALREDLGTIVERLVERELMRAEIDRFGVTAPPNEVLDARLEAVRKPFGSASAFAAALDACGLSEARFRAWIADDWRIEQYIQQRFEAAAQPTDEDVLQYYQSREREFIVNDRPRSFDEVREEARARLLASRRQALVDDWVAGLRRRAEVVIVIGREGM